MSDTTPRLDLPIPNLGDQASIEEAVRPLGLAVDAVVAATVFGLANDRPAPGVERRFFFGRDDKRLWFDTGSEWLLVAARGPAGGDLAGAYPDPMIRDGVVTAAKLAAALKPSADAGAADEALRALGTDPGRAAAGRHAAQHRAGGADPLLVSPDMMPSPAYAEWALSGSHANGGATLPFTGAVAKSDGYKASTASPIRPGAGLWLIVAEIDYAPGGGFTRQCAIQINGATKANDAKAAVGGGFGMSCNTALVLPLTATDVVSVLGFQDTGASLAYGAQLRISRLGNFTAAP